MADLLRSLHVTLNFTGLALVCIHGVAALKHHLSIAMQCWTECCRDPGTSEALRGFFSEGLQ
jgi:hypothetical protein